MTNIVRNQCWLESRLQGVWMSAFPDLVAANEVVIRYGQRARTRLGSIRMSRDGTVSTILINRLFQLEVVPLEVVDATIAHELTHYLHGFSSPLEQKFSTPHAGGVVTRELEQRGFGSAVELQKKWLKAQWPLLVREHAPERLKRRVRRRSCRRRWDWLRIFV